jgi:hypothetical protein
MVITLKYTVNVRESILEAETHSIASMLPGVVPRCGGWLSGISVRCRRIVSVFGGYQVFVIFGGTRYGNALPMEG